MQNYLLIIYPVIVLFITFFACKISNRNDYNKDFLSPAQGKNIEGAACLFIILHHLTQDCTSYIVNIKANPVSILNSMGILFTSIFFFFSGYGLTLSLINKKDYIKTFFWNRMPKILIPFFTTNLICVIYYIYRGDSSYTSFEAFSFITGLTLINSNSWFIVEIFYFYLFFFLIFKFIKKRKIAFAIFYSLIIAVIAYSFNAGHDTTSFFSHWFKGEWWYNSTIIFIIASLFALNENAIINKIKKHYKPLLIVFSLLFLIFFAIEERILNSYGYYGYTDSHTRFVGQLYTLLAQYTICILFMIIVLLINMKIKINNRVISFIGSISLELYLIHGLFLHIFEKYKTNSFQFYALVIIFSLCSAVILHYIDKKILSLIASLVNGKKYHDNTFKDLFKIREAIRLKKSKQRFIISLIAVISILSLIGIYYEIIKPHIDFDKEYELLTKAREGDTVKFGRLDLETGLIDYIELEWIVLKADNDSLMLISKNPLEGSSYSDGRREAGWENSRIRKHLNKDLFYSLFNKYEQNLIIANPGDKNLVSLLSVEEAREYYKDDSSRRLLVDPENNYAKGIYINSQSKVNNWDNEKMKSSPWWLRGDNKNSISAPLVSVDGEITEEYVYKYAIAIRPVIWIKRN